MTDVPRAATALLRTLSACVPAWSVYTHASSGTCEFGGLSEETDGEGKRHRVSNIEPVDSFLIRARHVDGRAFVAVWLARLSKPSKSGKPSWSLDTAWRGRRPGEYTPKQITARELTAYVEESSVLEEAA